MPEQKPGRSLGRLAFILLLLVRLAAASEYHGQVLFNGLPVPGALVTATQGKHVETQATDERGLYAFPNLNDGPCTVDVDMTGFAHLKQTIAIVSPSSGGKWDLTLLPADQILASQPKTPAVTATPAAVPDVQEEEAESLLINGSTSNSSTSVFRQEGAFGNNRQHPAALYNGGIGAILENSTLDAAPFSLTGQNTPKPSYNDITGILSLGGPLRIPHLINNGPTFFIGYQWIRDRNALAETALVPTAAQRTLLPSSQVSPVAESLLALYPLPNFAGSSRYNFQIPAVSATHQDSLQARLDKTVKKNDLSGFLALQSTRKDTPNVLGYADSTDTLGINTRANWSRYVHHALLWTLGYQFSRFSYRLNPFFANRTNISGLAGIQGNDQSPLQWGPPTLQFASGIAPLTDGIPASNHTETNTESSSLIWTHHTHSITLGGDYRREQLNLLAQENPRGTLSFTGAATGSDWTDFLAGIPDTSSIAFGNADKYLRESGYDGYIADDWRVNASLTANIGLRYEYAAPITELRNRLANLDVSGNFSQTAPVLASDPVGPLSGDNFSSALMHPDRAGWEPRVGIAWRPPLASSLIIRAGYGVYRNTSVYESVATQLDQQPPFSKNFNIQNTAANPLTLANPFNPGSLNVSNTFGIDPNFRVGYAQDWQLSIQRDLPGSLVLLATYSGIKGTRGTQEFLPNTVPPGGVACQLCNTGYTYLTSNGNSTRKAVQIELRRRLHNGFTAQLQYTFSKSLDDDSFLGGPAPGASTISSAAPQTQQTGEAPTQAASSPAFVAQNWLNLSADRALSNFDQRHLLSAQLQYTSGMGVKGGTLLNGWRGALLKEWTFVTRITAGSGFPLTPVYFAAVPGTGIIGTVRPNYTGAPLYTSPAGLYLNPAAYSAPLSGQWGNAGRNSITGPMEFELDATMGRTFRLRDRLNLDLRFDATNALNHVTYTSWNTVINNAQFGLPVGANAMRSIQTTLRLRF